MEYNFLLRLFVTGQRKYHGGEASTPVGGLMPNSPLGAGFGLLRLEFLAYDVENVEGQYGREKAPNGGERIIEKQIGDD